MFLFKKLQCKNYPTRLLQLIIFVLISIGINSQSVAEEYTFIVQPTMQPEKTKNLYRSLAKYISNETGHTFKIVTERNFLTYWVKMKKGKYDLILDAAHFTDYRINNLNYSVLAKIPDTVSYSLVTSSDNLVLELNELIGKRVLTLPPPSLGSVRLLDMFPNQLRQPQISGAGSAIESIINVKNGKYFAALVPTPLLNNYTGLNTVLTTPPSPHMAISASTKINAETQEKIRHALLKAADSSTGKSVLNALNIKSFSPATDKMYQGYEKYLVGAIGYRR